MTRHSICPSHRRRTDRKKSTPTFSKHSDDPKSHFPTVMESSFNGGHKKRHLKCSDYVPPLLLQQCCKWMWQQKGLTLGQTYYLALLCLSVYPNSSVWLTTLLESRASESHKNNPLGHSESCTWTKCDDAHEAWDEKMTWHKHSHQAQAGTLSDTYSMTPVR